MENYQTDRQGNEVRDKEANKRKKVSVSQRVMQSSKKNKTFTRFLSQVVKQIGKTVTQLDGLPISSDQSENGIGHAMLPQFLEIWLQSFKRTKNRL